MARPNPQPLRCELIQDDSNVVELGAALSLVNALKARIAELESIVSPQTQATVEYDRMEPSASRLVDDPPVPNFPVKQTLEQRLKEAEQANADLSGHLRNVLAALELERSENNLRASRLESQLEASLRIAGRAECSGRGGAEFQELESAPTVRDATGASWDDLTKNLSSGDESDLAFVAQCKREYALIQEASSVLELAEIDVDAYCQGFLLPIAQPIRRIQVHLHLDKLGTWSPLIGYLDELRAKTISMARSVLQTDIVVPVPGVTRFEPGKHEESPNHRLSTPPGRPDLEWVVYDMINPGFTCQGRVVMKAYVKIYAPS